MVFCFLHSICPDTDCCSISSFSLRGGSNSELLAKECARDAEEAGNRAERIRLKGKKIPYCIGCLSCIKTGKRVQKDDAPEIMEKLCRADVLVFATAADGGDATFEKAYSGLQGWVDCFPKAKLCGPAAGEEIGDPKDALKNPDVMKKAYRLGKEI